MFVCPQIYNTHPFTAKIINLITDTECSRSKLNDEGRCTYVSVDKKTNNNKNDAFISVLPVKGQHVII